jgi:4-hydroxy-tetrahydrodipicolinate reductase
MTYRVIQCYSGAVGLRVIRLAAADPRLDIVGLYVHAPDKAGRDIGELAGIAPVGIKATQDLDALLAAGADCAIWAGPRDDEAVIRILRAGINVYTLSAAYYLAHDADLAKFEAACQEGGATLMGGGNIPGLISDVAPLFLSGYTGEIRQIRVWQRNHVPDQPSEENLVGGCGFGQPCDLSDPAGIALTERWGRGLRQSAAMVADGLGLPLDELVVSHRELAPAPEDLFLPSSGYTVRKGTVAGVRWRYSGLSGGQEFYQVNIEMTVALNLRKGWRTSEAEPNWRIEIDGTPSLACDLSLGEPVGRGIVELNAARAVNAVPRIVEAPVGCRSILDMPAPTGNGLRRL